MSVFAHKYMENAKFSLSGVFHCFFFNVTSLGYNAIKKLIQIQLNIILYSVTHISTYNTLTLLSTGITHINIVAELKHSKHKIEKKNSYEFVNCKSEWYIKKIVCFMIRAVYV